MSNYTIAVGWSGKDALADTDPGKVISGADFNTEFTAVRTGSVMFGQLLHQTIEDIHKAVLKGNRDTLTNENIEGWFNTNYHLFNLLFNNQIRTRWCFSIMRTGF